MSNQYLVTTPQNPQYSGKVCGVRFENGRAFVSEYTLDPRLGWTVEDVIQRMKGDFGYDVQEVAAAPVPFPPETVIVGPGMSDPEPVERPVQPFEVLPSVKADDIHDDTDPVARAEVEFNGSLLTPKKPEPVTDENGIEQPAANEKVSLPRSNRQKRGEANAKALEAKDALPK